MPLTGGGETVQSCKEDLLSGIETLKDLSQFPIEEGQYELVYKYDMESLLNYYKGIFSNAALERLTGINQRQLQHYSAGYKKPRQNQIKKIETSLHKLGAELLAIEL